jgi:hypothetical protein
METAAFYQKKFIVDGRSADCTFNATEISIKFLEKSVFAFGEYANQMQSKIPLNTIINKLMIHRGFSLYHVSPKVKANQGILHAVLLLFFLSLLTYFFLLFFYLSVSVLMMVIFLWFTLRCACHSMRQLRVREE